MALAKNRKGILLTLAVLVLLVLMFAELLTYVVLGINYNYVLQEASSSARSRYDGAYSVP